jgi:hypothetical protein
MTMTIKAKADTVILTNLGNHSPRAVFTHGPKGPGSRGGILKKLRLNYGMREKKAVHETEI